jgi:hypothetical protein
VLDLRFTQTRRGDGGEVENYREVAEDNEWRVVSDYAVNSCLSYDVRTIWRRDTTVIRLAIHKLVLGLRFTRTRRGNGGLGEVEIYREEVEDLEWRVVSDYAVNTVIACRTYHLA